jgi:hypothetical protein
MADLRLRVGALTATANASDANATRILQGALQQHGYILAGMSGQQQANAVIDILVKFLNESAKAHEVNAATKTARDAVIAAPPLFNG